MQQLKDKINSDIEKRLTALRVNTLLLKEFSLVSNVVFDKKSSNAAYNKAVNKFKIISAALTRRKPRYRYAYSMKTRREIGDVFTYEQND